MEPRTWPDGSGQAMGESSSRARNMEVTDGKHRADNLTEA
jgi:hypothetical protein